jgi:chromosome segregation protein
MYLKRLELCGFKTFADKVELEFAPGITAVVGPNGCGKSNITDAVRWVLGEQSMKVLRSGRMEEVIFAGTHSRKPLGMAEVIVQFDNSDGYFPVDVAEVSVTRRIFRGGDVNCYLNNSPCRLKDVLELFMGTGIGQGAFCILTQNEIDLVLSSDSLDRREILEETAGINKYKFRKKEASRKLEATRANLLRLNDILREVEGQLSSLDRQVRRFKQYKKNDEKLKKLEIDFLKFEIREIRSSQAPLLEEHEAASFKLTNWSRDLELLEARMEGARTRVREQDAALEKERQVLAGYRLEMEKMESQVLLAGERENSFTRERERLEHGMDALRRKKEENLSRLEETQKLQEDCLASRKETECLLEREKLGLKKFEDEDAARTPDFEKIQDAYNRLTRESFSLEKEKERLHLGRQSWQEREKDSKKEAARLRQEIERSTESLQKSREKFEVLQAGLEDQDRQIKQLLKDREESIHALQGRKDAFGAARERFSSVEFRLKLLRELEDSLEGYSGAVKVLMKKKKHFPGLLGILSQAAKAREGFEPAFEALLSARLQDMVVEKWADAGMCTEFLSTSGGGRALFWVKEALKKGASEPQSRLPDEKTLGWARDYMDAPPDLSPVYDELLRNVVLVEDLSSAMKLAGRDTGRNLVFLTRGGEVVTHSSVSGGASQGSQASILSRKNEIARLDKNAACLKEDLGPLKREMDAASRRLENIEKQLETIRSKNSRNQVAAAELRKDVEAFQNRIAGLQVTLERSLHLEKEAREFFLKSDRDEKRIQEALQEMEARTSEAAEQLNRLQERRRKQSEKRDGILARIGELNVRLAGLLQKETGLAGQEKNLRIAIEETVKGMEDHVREREDLESRTNRNREESRAASNAVSTLRMKAGAWETYCRELSEEKEKTRLEMEAAEEALRTCRQEGKLLQEAVHQIELNKTHLDTQSAASLERLRELDIEPDKVDWLSVVPLDREAVQREIQRLRNFIRDFGSVNLGAMEEYGQLEDRHRHLKGQIDDLDKASEALIQVMNEIDETCISRFQETFEAVKEKFSQVFKKVFGGGQAHLILSEPDRMLDTGVEIVVQLPGKKLQSLASLSSGERALTALSFMLSILEVKPSPFVILDEVDAPLDDSNVEKIAQMLVDYSKNTQFIMITHNRKTMEFARRLYGVTMEEAGVSKTVSVALEEAGV